MIYEEGPNDVTGIINISEVMINYLSQSKLKDNILNTFKNELGNVIDNNQEFYGNMTSIEYVKAYIKENIINLYKIDAIELYRANQKGVLSAMATVKNVNPNRIDFISLNDSQRFQQGYILNKNVEINKLSDLIIKFKIAKPVNSSLIISPKIKIKLI